MPLKISEAGRATNLAVFPEHVEESKILTQCHPHRLFSPPVQRAEDKMRYEFPPLFSHQTGLAPGSASVAR
jgi:hypothetical protein